MKKSSLIFGSIGLFVFFILFSYLVHKNFFLQTDFNTTVRLQDHISRRFDGFFSMLSTFGRVEVMAVVVLCILFVYRKLKAFAVLFLFGFFHLFELYGKTFVKHLPPPQFLLRTQDFFAGIFPKYYVRTDNSYPSGHAARAVFVTAVIYLMIHKTNKLSSTQKMFIYAILISYDLAMLTSRVYLGEHWLSDVIGGSILGLSFAMLSGVFL